jgi:hypothetical protein
MNKIRGKEAGQWVNLVSDLVEKYIVSGAMLKRARAKESITQNDLVEKIRIFILI